MAVYNKDQPIQNPLYFAKRLFNDRKYTEVISLLEPQILNYRDSFVYFYYLGFSCFFLRDWGSAYTYLKSCYQIKPEHRNVKLMLGLALIRKDKVQEGLKLILESVESSPDGRGKSILRLIKHTVNNGKDIALLYESRRFRALLPQPIRPISYLAYFSSFALFFLIFSLILNFVDFSRLKTDKPVAPRDSVSKMELKEIPRIVDYSKPSRYLLTETELKKCFSRAKTAFSKNDDNLARKEINRILNANASTDLKDRALAIDRFLQQPDFLTLKTNFSFYEVSLDPYLYERCYVVWSGRVSNVKVLKNKISFDFLVGYENNKVVEGIVPVEVEFAEIFEETSPYEILAQIKVINENQFKLRLLSTHKLKLAK